MPRLLRTLGFDRPWKAKAKKVERTDDKRERDQFYTGKRWRELREYWLRQQPLCQRCLNQGRVKPAHVVHHKVERLDDPSLAYDVENLESLCLSCHARHHKRGHSLKGQHGSTDDRGSAEPTAQWQAEEAQEHESRGVSGVHRDAWDAAFEVSGGESNCEAERRKTGQQGG